MIPQLDYIEVGKSPSGKTLIKHVSCNGRMLGVIKWYPNWRKYCFHPEINTLFDAQCMGNIQLHLERMMYAHKGVVET